jgi:hypothetical protein
MTISKAHRVQENAKFYLSIDNLVAGSPSYPTTYFLRVLDAPGTPTYNSLFALT